MAAMAHAPLVAILRLAEVDGLALARLTLIVAIRVLHRNAAIQAMCHRLIDYIS
jgi:hypothetical protein